MMKVTLVQSKTSCGALLCAVTLLAVCATAPLAAETYSVVDQKTVSLQSGDVVAAGETESVPATLPSVGATPIFRFDCTQTNDWKLGAGTNALERIPSLDGTRYLYGKDGYMHDIGARDWDVGDYWVVQRPVFAHDETLGVNVVDFGEQGSQRAMLFDKEIDGTNQLKNIGTVIAVWNSAAGGGTILGGGWGRTHASVENVGNMWLRGQPVTVATASKNGYPVNPDAGAALFYNIAPSAYSQLDAASWGRARLDGVDVLPTGTGFNGGWQVVSIVPTNRSAWLTDSVLASSVRTNRVSRAA